MVAILSSSPVRIIVPYAPGGPNDTVALLGGNPGRYSYASADSGQLSHLTGELFKLAAGLDLLRVPFNGASPAMMEAAGGHVPIAFTFLPAAATFIREGKLHGSVITSYSRSELVPVVPTMAEVAFGDQEPIFVQGVPFCAGTPPDIVDRWCREIIDIVALSEVRGQLISLIGTRTGRQYAGKLCHKDPVESRALVKIVSRQVRQAGGPIQFHDPVDGRPACKGRTDMQHPVKDTSRTYEVERRSYYAARPGFRIAEMQISPTQCVPWHHHNQVQDTFYVISGMIRVATRDPDEEVRLGPGQNYAVRPGRPHRVTNAGDSSAVFLVLQGLGDYDFVGLS